MFLYHADLFALPFKGRTTVRISDSFVPYPEVTCSRRRSPAENIYLTTLWGKQNWQWPCRKNMGEL
jgi:hypothetical protein